MIVQGSNMGMDFEFPQQQLPSMAEIFASVEGRLGIRIEKLYFRQPRDHRSDLAHDTGIPPNVSVPWLLVEFEAGMRIARIADSSPPPSPIRPIVMLVLVETPCWTWTSSPRSWLRCTF